MMITLLDPVSRNNQKKLSHIMSSTHPASPVSAAVSPGSVSDWLILAATSALIGRHVRACNSLMRMSFTMII